MDKEITAGDVERMRDRLLDSSNLPTLTASNLEATLNKIADRVRYEGYAVRCDDGVESDEIEGILSGFGSGSFARYMYGD